MVSIVVKRIKSREFKSKVVIDELAKELRNQGQIVKRDLDRTVSTWNPKPPFPLRMTIGSQQLSARVVTSDQRFRYVNRGTRTRWAVMSQNWQSKSSPRNIGARAGSGRVVIRGRTAMQQRNIRPRRGIEACKFTEEIIKNRKKDFRKAMRDAITRGRKKARR